jgi:hypothetical protein
MRGENNMKEITAEFVHSAITDLINKRFRNEHGDIMRITCQDTGCQEETFYIENEIGTMLDVIGVDNEVEALLCFESPATDIYAICVVFMAEGTFHTHNFVTEA